MGRGRGKTVESRFLSGWRGTLKGNWGSLFGTRDHWRGSRRLGPVGEFGVRINWDW